MTGVVGCCAFRVFGQVILPSPLENGLASLCEKFNPGFGQLTTSVKN